jgi:hypothetical protein
VDSLRKFHQTTRLETKLKTLGIRFRLEQVKALVEAVYGIKTKVTLLGAGNMISTHLHSPPALGAFG